MSLLLDWAFNLPPRSFGPGGNKGLSFKNSQLDHPCQNLTCTARSLLGNVLKELAVQKRCLETKRCLESKRMNRIIIFKTIFKKLFIHAGLDPENPACAGSLQLGVDPVLVNALGRFSVHGGTVAQSVAAVGHVKDGVVYDGCNAMAAPCYQADSAAAAEKNDALVARLDSAIPTGCRERYSCAASSPPVFPSITDADRQKMATAAWTTHRVVNISTDGLKVLLDLVRGCPFDREIFEIMRMNSIAGIVPCRMLTLHTVATRRSDYRKYRDRRIDSNGGDSEKERRWRYTYAEKAVGYVACLSIASFISENEGFRQQFLPWLFDSFLPACEALTSERAENLLKPLLEVIESHGLNPLSRPGASDAGAAAGAGGGAAASVTGGAGLSPSQFRSFRNLKDQCHVCRAKFNGKFDWTCRCGVICCRACSGVPRNAPKISLDGKAYACDQCLQHFAEFNHGKKLLLPGPSAKTCSHCGFLLTSSFYCTVVGLCNQCGRGFCDACAALTASDLVKSKKWNGLLVARFDCPPCVGRGSFAQGRRAVFCKLIRDMDRGMISDARDRDPLRMEFETMSFSTMQQNKKITDALGELLFGVYYIGLRGLYSELLPFVMKLLLRQIELAQQQPEQSSRGLSICVSPFNMLLLSRTARPGATTVLDGEMLEKVCRAHALEAKKKGELLLQRYPAPAPNQERRPGRTRVLFYGPDLLKQGPLVNLVEGAISIFAEDLQYETWICAYGPPDTDYPVVRSLHDRFQGRVILFDEKTTPEQKVQLILNFDPDDVISFPGWTWGDMTPVLYVLKQHGIGVFNTLGYAGVMHFWETFTATIVGNAVGASQIASTMREALAVFAGNGCYQPPQSHPYLARTSCRSNRKAKARAEFNLPPSAFIAICLCKLDRLLAESISLFADFLRRVPNSCILLVQRPIAMQGQIEEWLESYGQDVKDRVLFRPSFADAKGFHSLAEAGDASVDSLGNYSNHTTASDAHHVGLPHFAPKDPAQLMQHNVGAEVAIAAGLEHVCVGRSGQDTIDLLVKYALDPELRERVENHLDDNIKHGRGLFCKNRVPRGWKSTLEFHRNVRAQGGGERPPDFQIPFEGEPAPVLLPIKPNEIEREIVRSMLGTGTKQTEEQLSDMLRGIKSQTAVEFHSLAGSDAFMHVIRCQTRTGQVAALKISKQSRPETRMHNDPALREAANLLAWHQRTQRFPIKTFLPAPLYLMEGGTSCFGTSRPDKDGKVFSFLFEEFIEGHTLVSLLDEHKQKWQAEGVLTEKMRFEMFNSLSQGVFWLSYFGLAVMDLKFDNVMVRKTGPNQGTIVIINTGLGHVFPRSNKIDSHSADPNPPLLNRRCTSKELSDPNCHSAKATKSRPKGCLFPVGRIRPGQLIRCITRKQVTAFLVKSQKTGLGNLAAGTTGFKAAQSSIGEKERCRRLVFSKQNMQLFDKKWAFSADLLAVHKMLFMMLTLRPGKTIADWDAEVEAAGKLGGEGLRAMLMASLNPGVEVQQPMALDRLVDFFVGGLGPGKRLDAAENIVHSMNTLPILPPQDELELRTKGCILLPGEVVTRPGKDPKYYPAVSFAPQKGKGIGLRAEEDIPPNTVIGPYAGVVVMNSVIGRPHVSLEYPSRFVVAVTGDIPALKESGDDKVSVDGQVTKDRDWHWVKINRNVGPFLNAPTPGAGAPAPGKDADEPQMDDVVGQADSKPDRANCVLDRYSLSLEPDGTSSMDVKSGPEMIRKGEYLQWTYDPKAGPGGFFKF